MTNKLTPVHITIAVISLVIILLFWFTSGDDVTVRTFAPEEDTYEWRWNQPNGHMVISYDVYVSEQSGQYSDVKIADAQAACLGEPVVGSVWSCYLEFDLPPSSTGEWFTTVVAINLDGESEPSNEMRVGTPPATPVLTSFIRRAE